MPDTRVLEVVRLKAAIIARVDAGETLRAICASPGMPAVTTTRNWARGDAAFAEALAAARRRAAWRAASFDEAKAEAFLERARNGETINSLIGRRGMISRGTYNRWRATQATFAEAVFALRQRRDAQIGMHGRARWRAFDQALADRIIVRLNKGARAGVRLEDILRDDPELPCWETFMRWRGERPEFDAVLKMITAAKRAMPPPIPETLVEAVLGHIVEGGTFLSFSRLPGAPSYSMLRRRMRDPKFAAEVAQACEWREDWYADQILMASERSAPGSLAARERQVRQLKARMARLRRRPKTPLGIYRRRTARAQASMAPPRQAGDGDPEREMIGSSISAPVIIDPGAETG